MNKHSDILLAFYGDDFTGSTDALEFICRAGAKAVLFIEPPTREQLNAFPGLNVFGVAGKTRSLPPEQMENILVPAFEKLKATGARHVHYKTCSTFDSSPAIGSIGKAIDCGFKVFDHSFTPVVGGTPALGRYCVFGNLFARMGIGSDGDIYRLDRHPSMSKHPVTPANESDLVLHLSKQTKRKIGLVSVVDLMGTHTGIDEVVNKWLDGHDVILFDALYEEHITKIGEYIDETALGSKGTLFSVGSSGVEMALGNYWNSTGALKRAKEWAHFGKSTPLLVISGSCSPVTASQITWAKANGFEEVELDAIKICNQEIIEISVLDKIVRLLQQQKNVIVHTGQKQVQNLSSEKLGTALGTIAKEAAKHSPVKRVIIAGGDTSSYAARAMEIEAVEMIAPFVTGAPLCRAYSKNNAIDGLEVNFKGGQVGSEDYFGMALENERAKRWE